MLEECAKKFGLKFCTMPSLGHECIVFDYNNLLKFVFKMHKLDLLASELEGIEISLTLDGAVLTNNLSHVTCGVKIIIVCTRKNSNECSITDGIKDRSLLRMIAFLFTFFS